MSFLSLKIEGISIPDSKLCKEITKFVRGNTTELLFNHSTRVFFFGALAGKKLGLGLKLDLELLYAGAMFHDIGLNEEFSSKHDRFEVDGANAASAFLSEHGVSQADIVKVWTAIALHTTPGIPQYMDPEIAMLTAGVEMDVLGWAYDQYTDNERQSLVKAYPRSPAFKEDIIAAFYGCFRRKPNTTFGTVNADVLADKDPSFKRRDFCDVIRRSPWAG